MTANPLAPSWLAPPADANDLAASVWPANARRSAADELVFAGVPASVLTERFGTPLYVVDEADARARARGFREAFERECARIGTGVTVYYAAKAFLSSAVAEWMTGEGLSVDVCSAGEFAVALAAGVAPARMGFHGNNKSLVEIDTAVEHGIGAIVVDSPIEVERIASAAERHGRVQAVRLRVNSGVHAHTHDFLATAHEDQKFGISLTEAPGVVASIRSHSSLRFLGLHGHIGSQIFGADGFEESAARLLGLHHELLAGGAIPELNLGGGFGIAYTAADDPTPVDVLARQIADIVASECARLGIAVPRLAFEPGRVIIGPSTVTLYAVGTVKRVTVALPAAFETAPDDSTDPSAHAAAGHPEPATAVRTYVSVDGGMSDNARPALYGADYTVRMANRVSAAQPALVRVAGKHCESGDIVVHADYLPGDVEPGDTLAVAATGAYCWSLSSNYNYLGRPPIVAVKGGAARLIMRGESIDDLLARDPGIGSATRKASTAPAHAEPAPAQAAAQRAS
ncbi:diaminopimelate decarboxylase family protein [Subtercola boreus]|uniref:Diaminopimelate decarboxylase n=1 Tax=Subtercola boreus TaxID=120213 RepID=A0A3E0W9C5_9MICO|nr:diaminopimelate decarboxylase [Subtercola boreus]RFA20287.1 diaminopimelate decarboxylase [Subtercola boreus]RFA20439.1 diaminopimelate decarboxylase [Subtercola boreus]RFA26691.1 diaminopimelate decarboxylase [Subtercola boreus]